MADKMLAPILITGLPRSGTSVTAGVFSLCGAWTGSTALPSPWNRKGTFENEALKNSFVKPVLSMIGADPLGLDRLPRPGTMPPIDPAKFRGLVHDAVRRQGWDGSRRWLFKDAKLALIAPLWIAAFPDADWIVVRRRRDAVIASALRAKPMAKRLGRDWSRWKTWAHDYLAHLESLAEAVDVRVEVWPARDIFEDPAGLVPAVKDLGLTWRPDAVADFVDASLWNESPGVEAVDSIRRRKRLGLS